MNAFTNAEMADMVFVYGLADGNSYEAKRIYEERYPQRLAPCAATFANLFRRLSESGSFKRNSAVGRPRTIRTPELEEAVLDEISEHPETSTRKISQTLNVNHMTVWQILKDQLLYPYHVQRVQALLLRDFQPRIDFAQWLQGKVEQFPQFISSILFTDEASFSRNGIMNFHNNHIWADENPHAITETRFQDRFSFNVWIGIIGNYLIGPHFLPLRLDGNTYQHFLQHELPQLMEDVPIGQRINSWFMHDGAPAHFSLAARNFLDLTYPQQWIGRGSTHNWPARSPDLNLVDFFLWGHLKSLVYASPIQDEEMLRNRIIDACEIIKNTPGIFQRVRDSLLRRAEACITVGGGHFQQLL
jgi:hypothetical protein